MNELATVSDEQLAIIKNTIAKDASPSELKLFLYDCQRQGVHPLDKLIHFTKRGGRYVPITSIDFLRRQAGSTGAYAGADDGEFTGEPGKAGFACRVTVYRMVQGVRCSWSATARWEEYYPGDAQGQMWRKMPHVMLSKVAEALALRKAFADVLHGLYTREEMDQAAEKPVKDLRSLKEKLGIVTVPPPVQEEPDPTPLMDAVITATWPPEPQQIGQHVAVAPAETNVGKAILEVFPEATFLDLSDVEEPPKLAPVASVEAKPMGFPIGKHKGEAIDAVPTGYLRWAAANITHEAARTMAQAELARRAEVEA